MQVKQGNLHFKQLTLFELNIHPVLQIQVWVEGTNSKLSSSIQLKQVETDNSQVLQGALHYKQDESIYIKPSKHSHLFSIV